MDIRHSDLIRAFPVRFTPGELAEFLTDLDSRLATTRAAVVEETVARRLRYATADESTTEGVAALRQEAERERLPYWSLSYPKSAATFQRATIADFLENVDFNRRPRISGRFDSGRNDSLEVSLSKTGVRVDVNSNDPSWMRTTLDWAGYRLAERRRWWWWLVAPKSYAIVFLVALVLIIAGGLLSMVEGNLLGLALGGVLAATLTLSQTVAVWSNWAVVREGESALVYYRRELLLIIIGAIAGLVVSELWRFIAGLFAAP